MLSTHTHAYSEHRVIHFARTVALSSIILIEYSREHKVRRTACTFETIRSVIRTKIIKRHTAFAFALLQDIWVLFEALGSAIVAQ